MFVDSLLLPIILLSWVILGSIPFYKVFLRTEFHPSQTNLNLFGIIVAVIFTLPWIIVLGLFIICAFPLVYIIVLLEKLTDFLFIKKEKTIEQKHDPWAD